MRFTVVINGVEISREWPWERIAKVKEELKKLGFRWTGVGWVGRVLDLSTLYSLKSLLDLSQAELEEVLKALPQRLEGAVLVVGQLPESLKPFSISSHGNTHILSISKFIREFVRSDKKYISYAKNFEEYISMAIEEFRRIIKGYEVHGDLDVALKAAEELALSSKNLRELYEKRMAWRKAEVWPTYALLNFASRDLTAELRSFKLAYNIVGKDGEVKQAFINLVKIHRENEKVKISFPIFIKDKIINVLRNYGYIIEERQFEYKRIEYRSSVELYDFQRRAVEAWLRAGMRGTIAIPTGGGKTFIALDAIAKASTSTLVLVVTKELAAQWANRIRRLLGASPGILGGGEHDIRDVTIAIYNSAVKYIDELVGKFGLVVFDEAHHVPAETFKEVALNIDSPYRLALSATPEREDGNQHLIFESVGPLVFRATYSEMIEAGLVVPVEHYRVYVEMTPEERQEYKSAEASTDNAILLRNIAAQASAKIPIAVEIVSREVKLNRKILVFTQFLEQAREIYRRLREAGISAELVTSEERDREAAFSRFASGVVKVVVTTTVLDEGVDVPDADTAVIVSGSGSKRQMIQRVGRVVRKAPGKKVARVYEIVTRDTIEVALSESRHINKVIEEATCRRLSPSSLRDLLNRITLIDFS